MIGTESALVDGAIVENVAFAHQVILTQFSASALKSDDLDEFLHHGCRLAGDALSTHVVKVMEVQDNGKTLLIRAGVGWKPGVVGKMRVETGERAAGRQVLQASEPLVSPNIETEDRLDYSLCLRDNGVQALAMVIIGGPDSKPPYGVLQVGSRVPRAFTEADMRFLRGYASLLAAAVERLRVLAELRERAEEKKRLLQELQHRMKNNLQTLMTLVGRGVRGARHPEAAAALRSIGDGIEALRLVHETIYRGGTGMGACLGTYLAELAASVLAFQGREVQSRVRLVSDVERIEVPPDIAIPVGLITSEFITNSLKYAFDDESGTIGLRVDAAGPGLARVMLWDDGKGLAEVRPGGAGIGLINGLARQVGATASWSGGRGTRLELCLPLQPSTPP